MTGVKYDVSFKLRGGTILLSLVLLFQSWMFAGEVTISANSPIVNGDDIFKEIVTSNSLKWWGDTTNRGQQFKTGAGTPMLLGFSFQLNSTSKKPTIPVKTYTMRVVSFSGSSTTTLQIEAGHTQGTTQIWSSGNWINFTLDTPLQLSPNTLYGVDAEMVSGGAWQDGIPYIKRSGSSVYADGAFYGRSDGDPSSASVDGSGRDLNFHINLAPPVNGTLFLLE